MYSIVVIILNPRIIPFGEFLRLRLNCTTLSDVYQHAEVLKKKLSDRGYPGKLIKQSFKRACFYNRDCLLEINKEKKSREVDRVVFVSQFSSASNKIQNIVNTNWKILNHGAVTQLQKPLFSFRRNKTMRNSLVKTYPTTSETQHTLNGQKAVGNHKSGSCSICPPCIETKSMSFAGKTMTVTTLNTCCSKNVIYLLVCPCRLGYVGETYRELCIRLLEYKSAIRMKKENAPLTDHFSRLGHNCD